MSVPLVSFTVLPAIDLKGGRCVRLRQGLAAEETVYSDQPAAMAGYWSEQGASWLHVVDLDGAFQGKPVHSREIAEIVAAVSIPVEVGGGIRTRQDVESLLALGVKRVIVGTKAVEALDELEAWASAFGPALAVGVDARNGMVQVRGWTETTGRDAVQFASELAARGVQTLIYTDTATDGMMQGPNIPAVAVFCKAVKADVIASGGVRSASDIRALLRLRLPNLAGAIVGKALYEQRNLLPELLDAARFCDDATGGLA